MKLKSIKSNLIVATIEASENKIITKHYSLNNDNIYPRTFIFPPGSRDIKHEFKEKHRTYKNLIQWISAVIPMESIEELKFIENELNSDLQLET